MLLPLLPKTSKTIEIYSKFIFTRMNSSSPCSECEGFKNSASCWKYYLALEETSYLIAQRVCLVEEVNRELIAQAKKEEQDCCDQRAGELTAITFKKHQVASARRATGEEEGVEEAKASKRGEEESTVVDLTGDKEDVGDVRASEENGKKGTVEDLVDKG